MFFSKNRLQTKNYVTAAALDWFRMSLASRISNHVGTNGASETALHPPHHGNDLRVTHQLVSTNKPPFKGKSLRIFTLTLSTLLRKCQNPFSVCFPSTKEQTTKNHPESRVVQPGASVCSIMKYSGDLPSPFQRGGPFRYNYKYGCSLKSQGWGPSMGLTHSSWENIPTEID